MSPDTLTDTDLEFLDAFLSCRLDVAGFDHRGHLRIAWLLLQRHPLEVAVERTCDGIQRLAAHLGVPGKYHRTLSEALVRLMAAADAAAPASSFDAFLTNHPELLVDARAVLARHYSPARLTDPAARTTFLPPDLQPLPDIAPHAAPSDA